MLASPPAAVKEMAYAHAVMASRMPNTRAASRSGTSSWSISRSCTSITPLPKPATTKVMSRISQRPASPDAR